MAQNKRVAKISKVAPVRFDGGGFAWDNSGYAFDPDFLTRASKKQVIKVQARERYFAKRREKRDTRKDMVKRFGSV